MKRNDENIMKLAQFIKGFSEKEKTPPFTVDAVCAIIEYSSRTAERQDKLSTRFNRLTEVMGEAATWAKLNSCA